MSRWDFCPTGTWFGGRPGTRADGRPGWTGRELVRDLVREPAWTAAAVELIGSTSVPGLDAKPVVDVQVGCAAAKREAAGRAPAPLACSALEARSVEGITTAARRASRPT
ncbi:GrpB family protein [Streptomyces atroolivaceus]|uniref:GrpB family protein n=1 Tax=Streptomyces atroolivaceus TaxID=66869 RepID=UPI0036666988